MDTMLSRLVRWVVSIGIVLIPLWFLPFTSDIVEFNKQVLLVVVAGLGLILYLVDIVRRGQVVYRTSPFYLAIMCLIVATLITSIFSVIVGHSIFGIGSSQSSALMSWVAYGILFFLALSMMRRDGSHMQRMLTFGFVATLLLGALQLFSLSPFTGQLYGVAAFNTIGSANSLGFFAALTLPFFLSSWQRSATWYDTLAQLLRYVGMALGLLILIAINWLPLWIVTFVGMIAYLGFSALARPESIALRSSAFPMVVIVLGIFLMLVPFEVSFVKNKLPLEIAPTHAASYDIAFNALEQRPVGYGPENFFVAYDQFKPEDIANTIFFQTRFSDATSEFVNMITEGGVVMLLAFLFFCITVIRTLYKDARNHFGHEHRIVGLWASVLGSMTLLFLYPSNITFWIILLVLLALISVVRDMYGGSKVIDLERNSTYSFIGSLGFIIGVVVVLVGGYFTVNRYIANVHIAQARTTDDPSIAIEHLVDAVNAYPTDLRAHRLLSQAIIVKIADDLQTGPEQGESQADYSLRLNNQIDSATRIAITTTDDQPADSENWMNRGLVYQNLLGVDIEGSGPFAISMYEEALKRNPANPLAYTRIGSTYLNLAQRAQLDNAPQSEIEEHLHNARENYEKAIDLYSNYGQALFNLAVVYDQLNQVPQAIEQFERLVISNPRDASLVFQLGLLYYRNDQKTTAIAAWEQAVRLFPDYSNARWYLSLAYEEQDNLEAALAQAEAIEELNPGNELVQQRLEQLRSGERLIPPQTVLDQEPLN